MNKKRVYLLGIGGIGMANFAVLLQEAGWNVTGSDTALYEPSATILRCAGIHPLVPFAVDNLPRDDTPVVVGNALSRGNVEVEAALAEGLPLFSFPEFLRQNLLQKRRVLVVAGTHGKSTTSACLAHLLEQANMHPGFLVGALLVGRNSGASFGSADGPFVIEGDEYDSAFFDKRSKFLHYFPRVLALGAIEFDHADIFPAFEDMLRAYRLLLRLLPQNGRLLYYANNTTATMLSKEAPCPTVAVGASPHADWQLLESEHSFRFRAPDASVHECTLALQGRHNQLNALMALATATEFCGQLELHLSALPSFRGLRRRFELLAASDRLTVVDDFAHHPTAIAATLRTARQAFPACRILAVFEPRSNTMVRNIFQSELAQAFTLADEILVGTIHRLERIPVAERLDIAALRASLQERGIPLHHVPNSEIPLFALALAARQPTVVLFLSNGSFDGAPQAFVNLARMKGLL